MAGRDLDEYLIKLMEDAGRPLSNNAETKKENARDTKEKCCYVVSDFEAELKTFSDKDNTAKEKLTHRMPDGIEI